MPQMTAQSVIQLMKMLTKTFTIQLQRLVDSYKQVGMKDKGGKKVPNCVPESVNEQDDSMTMAKDMKKKKRRVA